MLLTANASSIINFLTCKWFILVAVCKEELWNAVNYALFITIVCTYSCYV